MNEENTVNTGAELSSLDRVNQKDPSKYDSECTIHATNSYKCLEKNGREGSKCAEFFDIYRACRKAEQTRIIEERRKRNVYIS